MGYGLYIQNLSRALRHCAWAGAGLLAVLCLCLTANPVQSASANRTTDIFRAGSLPNPGRVVIRSGLAWLDESSPAFQAMQRGLQKELTALGFTVVPISPSKLDPMPKTPMPSSGTSLDVLADAGAKKPGAAPEKREAETAREKTQNLGKDGKLPKLTLRSYETPQRDADLPQTVRSIRSPDISNALYARSQELGKPVVQQFAIPGRIPQELQEDASKADYALVVRFAAVRSWGSGPELFSPLYGVLVAAAVKGTGALGYGTPPARAASRPNTYGTPGGYMRGYEGAYPNDPWGRDRDFYQRDYMFKYGEQPQYASPPKDFTPGIRNFPGAPSLTDRSFRVDIDEWLLIIMDLYDLAPIKNGGKAAVLWSTSARRPLQGEKVTAILPSLAASAFAVHVPAKTAP